MVPWAVRGESEKTGVKPHFHVIYILLNAKLFMITVCHCCAVLVSKCCRLPSRGSGRSICPRVGCTKTGAADSAGRSLGRRGLRAAAESWLCLKQPSRALDHPCVISRLWIHPCWVGEGPEGWDMLTWRLSPPPRRCSRPSGGLGEMILRTTDPREHLSVSTPPVGSCWDPCVLAPEHRGDEGGLSPPTLFFGSSASP